MRRHTPSVWVAVRAPRRSRCPGIAAAQGGRQAPLALVCLAGLRPDGRGGCSYGYFPPPSEAQQAVLYVGSNPDEVRPYFDRVGKVADGGRTRACVVVHRQARDLGFALAAPTASARVLTSGSQRPSLLA